MSRLTFRTTITLAVMAFITALATFLILIQTLTFHLAAREAASAYMDAASANSLSRLEAQVAELALLVTVLSKDPFLADSDDRSAVDGAIALFKTAIDELPQSDSLYVGYDNGCWLQVRRLDNLDPTQRRRVEAPANGVYNINLVRPAPGGALPMRRFFEDQRGDKLKELELKDYGYDARKRSWYQDAARANRAVVSAPYASYSIAAPMITLSAPLRGKVRGVVAIDLKLDKFSEYVDAQRPGQHGAAIIFDSSGKLIAHPDLARFMDYAMTHPSHPQLPKIREVRNGTAAAVIRGWDGSDRYEGSIRDDHGHDYFFRLRKFSLGYQYDCYLLLLAAEDDFVKNVRRLQIKALILALIAGGCFIPGVWIFGSRMSGALKRITAQAGRLRMLVAPDHLRVRSYVREIDELGTTMMVAQRAIWSFARFVPKEMVKGVIDGSISAELGGTRRELTILFSDVRDFTGIAEAADPDMLMRQTSRYFTALTAAFLAEGGTVDKFIGDGLMAFWNAPHLQPDHVERACRAALSAKLASEQLNAQFEVEGLPPFFTRIGIHVGDAVVGNLGSTERMDYTALGTTVNLASRLEGLNKEYRTAILVSEAVCTRVEHQFQLKAIASVIAKGMTQETRVYELIGAIAS